MFALSKQLSTETFRHYVHEVLFHLDDKGVLPNAVACNFRTHHRLAYAILNTDFTFADDKLESDPEIYKWYETICEGTADLGQEGSIYFIYPFCILSFFYV